MACGTNVSNYDRNKATQRNKHHDPKKYVSFNSPLLHPW
jgi:hypothetical protein